ncbi:MAG: DNA double-strand break repair nuclease NurA [Acidilobaceae archaeon]
MNYIVKPSVLDSLLRIAYNLRRISYNNPSLKAKSVLRLEDTLRLREPIEDSGPFAATLYESTNRPLIPKRIQYGKRSNYTIIGLDSSSRSLEAGLADIVIGSVCAFNHRFSYTIEWPSISGVFNFNEYHPVFYILPNTSEPLSIQDPLLSTTNVAGRSFDLNYSIGEAESEMRVSLENWMLKILSSIGLDNTIIFIDGPIYNITKALVSNSSPDYIREVWIKLLESRVEAIRRLENKGLPVIGVVKRVDKSTILYRTRGLEYIVKRDVPEGDASILLRVYLDMIKTPGRVYVTPKIKVSSTQVEDLKLPSKIVQYVLIPPGMYQLESSFTRVYRLEYTNRTLEILESRGLDPVVVFISDSILSGALEPISIKFSDKRSSSIAESLKKKLAMSLASFGAPLSYSSLKEAEITWRS